VRAWYYLELGLGAKPEMGKCGIAGEPRREGALRAFSGRAGGGGGGKCKAGMQKAGKQSQERKAPTRLRF